MQTSLSPSAYQADPFAERYEAEISILCESALKKVVYLGYRRGMDRQDLLADCLMKLPRSRQKITDTINETYANPRPPEPLPMDDPLPESQFADQESEIKRPLSDYIVKENARLVAECQAKEAEIQNTKRFHFRSAFDLCAAPVESNWLIKNYMTSGMGMIFGEPGSMKTGVALDVGLSVASLIDWQGNNIRKSGPVYYIAGEGISAFNRRIKAWSIRNQCDLVDIPFYVSDRAAQFLDDPQQVIHAIDELQFENNDEPVLIIIDTLSRNFGSGDESLTKDMARFVYIIDEAIRSRYQCTVLIIHHSGLTEKERSRGSSALRAAVDFEYQLSKKADGTRVLKCTKAKDFEEPQPICFKPEIITLDGWVDPDDGEVMTSFVLVRTDGVMADTKPLTGTRKIVYDALVSIGDDKVHVKSWREASYSAGISSPTSSQDAKRKAFDRALKDLHFEGLVDTDGSDYWWIKPDTGQNPDMSGQ